MRTVEHLESEAEHFNLLPDTLKLSFFLREKNEPCQRSAVALPSPLLSLCKSDSFLKNLLAVPGHAGYRILIPCVCAQSRPTLRPSGLKPARLLCPWDFSRQEYWSGLSFPPPGDLSHPWIESMSPEFPELAGRFFTTEPPGRPS